MAEESKPKTGKPRIAKKEAVLGEVTPETKEEAKNTPQLPATEVNLNEDLAVFSRNNRCTYKSQIIGAGTKFYLEKEEHFSAKSMMWVKERPRINSHGKAISPSGKGFKREAIPGTFRKAMQDIAD